MGENGKFFFDHFLIINKRESVFFRKFAIPFTLQAGTKE